jgi:cell division septal protein FtsQ
VSKRVLLILKSKLFVKILLALIIVCLAVWLVIFSQIFQIKHIHIFGMQGVSEQEIKNTVEPNIKNKVWLWETRNIFFVDMDKIKEDILSNFPEIIEVEISKKFPDALNVDIIERNQSAILIWLDKQFFIDNQGVIFERVFDAYEDQMKIKSLFLHKEPKLGDEVIEPETLSKIFIIETKLRKLEIPIEVIKIVSNSRVNVITREGWEIYFNTNSDVAMQTLELEMVLKEKIPPENREGLEYIDLRFDKIFFKFKSVNIIDED